MTKQQQDAIGYAIFGVIGVLILVCFIAVAWNQSVNGVIR